ncbi:hypothetical protein CFP56_009642 [Quercus suber]|uniref:Uncharacterized protein n=1 Tax=Quercus suber TaxID=58331 RepID=A0AAW0M657_QUESU
MSYHSRRILTPGASRKRKERGFIFFKTAPAPAPVQASKPSELKSSNRLLAGYMAYEFLTRGTLLGQKFDPAQLLKVKDLKDLNKRVQVSLIIKFLLHFKRFAI